MRHYNREKVSADAPGELAYPFPGLEKHTIISAMGIRQYRTYFLTPLVYAAIIFGLLFLQFARRSEKFFDSVTELVLNGTMSAEEAKSSKEKAIEELHLRYKGIDFAFGGRYGAELIFQGGSAYKLNPAAYKKTETGFAVSFDRNVSLAFILDSSKELLSIHASIGKQAAGTVQALVMGFSVVEGARVNSVERMPILSVDHKEKNYLLSLPENSSIDMARQLLVVVPEGESAVLSFGPPAQDTREDFRQWYANQVGNARTPADALTRKVSEYISGSYQGWKAGRYSAEEGAWLNESNNRSFKETLVTAYLAEAVRRGEYRAAYEQVKETARKHSNSLTFLSSPFLGNIQSLSERLLADDQRESARIMSLVRSRDSSVWSRRDLLQFAAMRGAADLKGELLKFAPAVNLQTVSLSAALGMLNNYYDAADSDPESAAALKRFADLINSKIFPAIIKIEAGFFLESAPGKIDVYLSVLAGQICIRAGSAEKDPVLEAIGRDLIISVLNLSDRQGFLPKDILVAEGILRGTEGRIAPEDIYTLTGSNPYYPHFVDLTRRIGAGAWLYTAAITSPAITPEKYTFRFQFPVGETHHFVFHGAKQYTEIQLWKIPWRIDARFENYNIGAYFVPEKNLFMAKYNHRNREEEFLMLFGGLAAQQAGAEGAAANLSQETE
ncbi:MAG: hypothetical protein LBQ57_09085 [Spirochaetales bacterium]|nr:hypothetical protein [Spirochaetales bacterium]